MDNQTYQGGLYVLFMTPNKLLCANSSLASSVALCEEFLLSPTGC